MRPTLNNRGNVLWALNRRDEALQSYDRALALNPDDLSTLKDRGTALLNSDRSEEALAWFDRALDAQAWRSLLLVQTRRRSLS